MLARVVAEEVVGELERSGTWSVVLEAPSPSLLLPVESLMLPSDHGRDITVLKRLKLAAILICCEGVFVCVRREEG